MTELAGDRLREFVEARMVVQKIDTLAELQRQSGVSYDTIQKVLAGRVPNRTTLTKLAAPLGVTYNDLVAWWIGLGVLAALSLPWLADTMRYPEVILNSHNPGGLLYSAYDLPMVVIPVIAWATRRDRT